MFYEHLFYCCCESCSVVSESLWPMDYSLPGSSVHGTLQTRILEWVAILFSRGSFWLRDQIWVSCIADRFFTVWATREASKIVYMLYEHLFLVCFRVTSVISLTLSEVMTSFSSIFLAPEHSFLNNFSSSVTSYILNLGLCPYLRNSDTYWFVSISPDHWSLGFVLLLLVLLLAVVVLFFSSKVYFFLVFANKQKSVFTNVLRGVHFKGWLSFGGHKVTVLSWSFESKL